VENGCGPDEKGGAALMVAGRFFDRINKIIQDLQDGDGEGNGRVGEIVAGMGMTNCGEWMRRFGEKEGCVGLLRKHVPLD
jgi:hypothetical protein